MKYTFFILLLTIPIASCSSDAPDESIKIIQEWADGLQTAVKKGAKPAIKSFFHEGAVFFTCEHNQTDRSKPYKSKAWRREQLVELFAKPNPEFSVRALSSRYTEQNSPDDGRLTFAFLVITGFQDPIAHEDFRFFVKNNKAQYYIGEYLPCGWAQMNCWKTCE